MNKPSQQQYDPAERRADAAHPSRDRSITSQLDIGELSPSLKPIAAGPGTEIVERLEVLDDLVFEAIAGKSGALEQLRLLWPQTLKQLGPELLDESRSQYLRHAMNVWKDCLAAEEIRNPLLAVAAIDVINVLLGA
ncbi:MAG TPA: hypothetical protein VIK18_06605 [Pirellulales bacterium]